MTFACWQLCKCAFCKHPRSSVSAYREHFTACEHLLWSKLLNETMIWYIIHHLTVCHCHCTCCDASLNVVLFYWGTPGTKTNKKLSTRWDKGKCCCSKLTVGDSNMKESLRANTLGLPLLGIDLRHCMKTVVRESISFGAERLLIWHYQSNVEEIVFLAATKR